MLELSRISLRSSGLLAGFAEFMKADNKALKSLGQAKRNPPLGPIRAACAIAFAVTVHSMDHGPAVISGNLGAPSPVISE
jgi:hypothetical protein